MSLYAPRRLDDKGRCCGRKPLVYKRPVTHFFCTKCDAEFAVSGKQRPNWAWLAVGDNFTPKYASGPHIDLAREALIND